MAKKKQKPLTREDVLRLIEENGGKAEGLDLSGKTFEEGIDLSGLDLHGIILNRAVFPLKIEPSDWRAFGKGAQLQEVNLSHAQLKEAELAAADLQRATLRGAQLQRIHLLLANLRGASLRDAQLDDADLSDAQLQGADLSRTKLQGTSLYRAKFSPDTKLEDTDWGNHILGEEKGGLFDWAVATYRQLKVWYTNAGYSDIAAKFYYREKEANRKALKWLSKSSFCHRLALELSYLVFGYGERWRRVPLSMAVLLLLFASAYYFGGNLEPLDSLYYSAVSFTALGYGKWALEPIGWVKGLGAFEAFIGVFMMALLLVTFVRKWTR